MLDVRHPEDTLFIVAEQDYRFYPEDCVADWYGVVADVSRPGLDHNRKVIMEDRPEPPSPSPAGDPPSPSPDEDVTTKPRDKKRKYIEWFAAQHPTETNQEDISKELRELVQLCNRASMINRGHVVWMGWCPAGKRRSVPSFASHLVCVTKVGAKKMLEGMENGKLKKGHWDRVLRGWLVGENFQNPKVMGACFVWPTVGFYQTHASGCEPGIGDRVAHWDQTYIQAGVAPTKSEHRARWLACWPADDKGGAEWLDQVDFYIPQNVWYTLTPPDRWWSTDNDWRRLLWNRWWVDDDGNWLGPKWAAENKGAGKKKEKKKPDGEPGPPNKWMLLLRNPDEYEWDYAAHCYSPITRCAEQLVVDWDNFRWNAPHTQREWNTRKKAIALYKRRAFADSSQASVYINQYCKCDQCS